jgi:hypothetical protein
MSWNEIYGGEYVFEISAKRGWAYAFLMLTALLSGKQALQVACEKTNTRPKCELIEPHLVICASSLRREVR